MEAERDPEREGETNRLMEELQELLSSRSEHARDDVPAFDGVGIDSFPISSFNHLQLNVRSNMTHIEQPAGTLSDTNYREKLRSYSSFPALSSPAATLSDTSSQCTNIDMMDIMYEQSLSDGEGSGSRRRPRPQVRQRRGSQSKGKSQADLEFLDTTRGGPSRRSYECEVCRRTFPSGQSLGGHKNLHNCKGKILASRRRYRAAPTVDQTGGQAGSESKSSESESVPSQLFKGVRCREGDKWVTEIRPPKSSDKWWLGTFLSAEEAAQAYDVALAFFKSESELNFGHHPLYQKFPPLPPDLSTIKYAQRLREMVKEISKKIIAERRRLEEQAACSSSIKGPAVSPAGSSSTAPTTLQDLLEIPDFEASEFEWTKYLNF